MKLKDILKDNKVFTTLVTGKSCSVCSIDFSITEYQATFIHIPVLNVNVHYYSSLYFCEGDGFDVENDNDDVKLFVDGPEGYVFFDTDTKECVYDMSGSALEVCISDFLHEVKGENWSMDDIEDLDCEVIEDIAVIDNYVIEGRIGK